MKRFAHISVIDVLSAINMDAAKDIQAFSEDPVVFPGIDARDEQETIERIGIADAVLASWDSRISSRVLNSCPSIRYIGVCATAMKNVDIDAAKKRGITVSNVADYADEATAEWVFLQLLLLARGIGKYMWKNAPCELNGKTIGIVGLGAVGKEVARLALGFNMTVLYSDLVRHQEWEAKGLVYADLAHLLQAADIVDLHVPQTATVLGEKEFALISPGCILVDTCLGVVFDIEAFAKWLSKGQNLVVFDIKPALPDEIKQLHNVVTTVLAAGVDREYAWAGRTIESRDRVTQKVLRNMEAFLLSA